MINESDYAANDRIMRAAAKHAQATREPSPHERVTHVLRYTEGSPLTGQQRAEAIIEALRKGSVERKRAELANLDEEIAVPLLEEWIETVNEILGTSD